MNNTKIDFKNVLAGVGIAVVALFLLLMVVIRTSPSGDLTALLLGDKNSAVIEDDADVFVPNAPEVGEIPKITIIKKFVKKYPPQVASPSFDFYLSGGGLGLSFSLKDGEKKEFYGDVSVNAIKEGVDYQIEEIESVPPKTSTVDILCLFSGYRNGTYVKNIKTVKHNGNSKYISGLLNLAPYEEKITKKDIDGNDVTITNKITDLSVICTFTNTDNTPPTTSITLIKEYIPGTIDTDYGFNIKKGDVSSTGTGAGIFLDDDGDNTSKPPFILSNLYTEFLKEKGKYTIEEVISGSDVDTSYSCRSSKDQSKSLKKISGKRVVVDLDLGENITCTFYNTKKGYIAPDIGDVAAPANKIINP